MNHLSLLPSGTGKPIQSCISSAPRFSFTQSYDGQAGRQTVRQTGRQTDRQTDSMKSVITPRQNCPRNFSDYLTG